MKTSILIIEDEPTLAKLLSYNLTHEGYAVQVIDHGGEGLREALHKAYDLILLDIMLPGLNGFEVLNQLRAGGNRTPVIILTARNAEEVVQGLTSGADDYITKPFSVAELFARVAAVLRRIRPGSENSSVSAHAANHNGKEKVITFGELNVYPDKYEATLNDAPVPLRPKEFEILLYMIEHAGTVVTRDRLMNAVWGYDYFGGGRTIDVHFSSLRKKLESGRSTVKIESVRGVGYKLIAR